MTSLRDYKMSFPKWAPQPLTGLSKYLEPTGIDLLTVGGGVRTELTDSSVSCYSPLGRVRKPDSILFYPREC